MDTEQVSEESTLSRQYLNGELPHQNGIEPTQQRDNVFQIVARVFGDQERFEDMGIGQSRWNSFSDSSGKPLAINIRRDGYFNMEVEIYDPVWQCSDADILKYFTDWEDN